MPTAAPTAPAAPAVEVDASPAAVPHERRRDARKVQTCDAFVASPTDPDPARRWEVASVNLSRHGIAFTSPKPLPARGYFKIDLGFGPQRLVREVRVTHCRPAEGGFEVGAEFV